MRNSVKKLLLGLFIIAAWLSISQNVMAADTTWQNDYTYTLDATTGTNYIVLTKYNGAVNVDIVVPQTAEISGVTYYTKIGPSSATDGIFASLRSNMSANKSVTIQGAVASKNSLNFLFYNCSMLSAINVNITDASLEVSMESMFAGCWADTITYNFTNMQNVTSTKNMFNTCIGLTSLDLSKLDMSHVTNADYMLEGCNKVQVFDMSSWDLSNVTAMNNILLTCSAKITVMTPKNLNKSYCSLGSTMYDADGNTYTYFPTAQAYSITLYNVRPDSTWQNDYTYTLGTPTGLVGNYISLNFYNGSSEDIIIPATAFISGVEYKTCIGENYLFNDIRAVVKTVDFKEVSLCKDMDLNGLLSLCENLYRVKINFREAPGYPSFKSMFLSDSSLSEVYISGCTVQPRSVASMYCQCSALTGYSIIMSNVDTQFTTDFSDMFMNDTGLSTIDLSLFKFDSAVTISSMFDGCSNLISITLSPGIVTSNLTDMSRMLANCNSLTSVENIENIDTSKVTNMDNWMNNCSSITSIDMHNYDMSKVTSANYMLNACSSVTSIKTPTNLGIDISLPYTIMYRADNRYAVYTMPTGLSTSLELTKTRVIELSDLPEWLRDYNITFSGSLIILNTYTGEIKSDLIVYKEAVVLGDTYSIRVRKFGAVWTNLKNDLNTIEFENGFIFTGGVSRLFTGMSELTNIVFNDPNTTGLGTLSNWFQGCSKLTSVDLSLFELSGVRVYNYTFADCSLLSSIKFPEIMPNVGVTLTEYMFSGCSVLRELDIRWMDFVGAISSVGMFNSTQLTSLYTPVNVSTDVVLGSDMTNEDKSVLYSQLPKASAVTVHLIREISTFNVRVPNTVNITYDHVSHKYRGEIEIKASGEIPDGKILAIMLVDEFSNSIPEWNNILGAPNHRAKLLTGTNGHIIPFKMSFSGNEITGPGQAENTYMIATTINNSSGLSSDINNPTTIKFQIESYVGANQWDDFNYTAQFYVMVVNEGDL